MSRTQSRFIFLLVALASFGSIALAVVYFQGVKQLLPCPMCVGQRIAYGALGATALLAAVHGANAVGRRAYAALVGVFALGGLASAVRQVWLTYHPQGFDCGISPEEQFLNALPLAEWWPALFKAEGDCAEVAWRFLGLSIPEWSAVAFSGLLLLSLWLLIARQRRR